MDKNLDLIKKVISILSTGTTLIVFLITIFTTNKKSPNFIEYTSLSKFLLNLYTLFVLSLIFAHTVYPQIICSIFTKRFNIITSENGKLILLSSIFIMYFGTGSKPQKIFGMIAFLCAFMLFLSKLFLPCKSFKKNAFVEEKIIKNTSPNTNNLNITTSTATTDSFKNLNKKI